MLSIWYARDCMSIGNIDTQLSAVGTWTHEIKVTSEGNAVCLFIFFKCFDCSDWLELLCTIHMQDSLTAQETSYNKWFPCLCPLDTLKKLKWKFCKCQVISSPAWSLSICYYVNYLSCYIGQLNNLFCLKNQRLSSCNASYYSAGPENRGVCVLEIPCFKELMIWEACILIIRW